MDMSSISNLPPLER